MAVPKEGHENGQICKVTSKKILHLVWGEGGWVWTEGWTLDKRTRVSKNYLRGGRGVTETLDRKGRKEKGTSHMCYASVGEKGA